MAISNIKAAFQCDIQRVWEVVTSGLGRSSVWYLQDTLLELQNDPPVTRQTRQRRLDSEDVHSSNDLIFSGALRARDSLPV